MSVNKPDRLGGIESLRAYAALSIIMFHLVHSGGAAPPPQMIFIKSHFGFGVPLFFVLSGFSLTYGYIGRLTTRSDLVAYFIRRIARIAPLFYAALIVQVIVAYTVWGSTYSVIDLILNAAFLFNLVPHLSIGVVPASWSIGVEMIFYVMFLFIILLCTDIPRLLVALLFSVLLAVNFQLT